MKTTKFKLSEIGSIPEEWEVGKMLAAADAKNAKVAKKRKGKRQDLQD